MSTSRTMITPPTKTQARSATPLAKHFKNRQRSSVVLTCLTILSILLPILQVKAWTFVCVSLSDGRKGCCFVRHSCASLKEWADEGGHSIRSCVGFKAAKPGTVITIKKTGAFLSVKGENTPIYDKMFDPVLPAGFIEKMSKELNIPIVKEEQPGKGARQEKASVARPTGKGGPGACPHGITDGTCYLCGVGEPGPINNANKKSAENEKVKAGKTEESRDAKSRPVAPPNSKKR